ncbi:MAG: hypothetical protein BWX70_00866 [Verrucomicrobia bacterium ADurb.Bin070]|nr:MAG: hypothetical protein BWX70_00866 [Verrucomicrobia bacterium ADurb.Bin070]
MPEGRREINLVRAGDEGRGSRHTGDAAEVAVGRERAGSGRLDVLQRGARTNAAERAAVVRHCTRRPPGDVDGQVGDHRVNGVVEETVIAAAAHVDVDRVVPAVERAGEAVRSGFSPVVLDVIQADAGPRRFRRAEGDVGDLTVAVGAGGAVGNGVLERNVVVRGREYERIRRGPVLAGIGSRRACRREVLDQRLVDRERGFRRVVSDDRDGRVLHLIAGRGGRALDDQDRSLGDVRESSGVGGPLPGGAKLVLEVLDAGAGCDVDREGGERPLVTGDRRAEGCGRHITGDRSGKPCPSRPRARCRG